MDRLKKLWNCYKEKSLDRYGNSISSDSSSASANNVNKVDDNDVKVAKDVRCQTQLIVCFFFLSFFPFSFLSRLHPFTSFPSSSPPPYRHWRAELNNLQANVEFLTSRIDSAAFAAKPADSYQYESTTTNDVIDPIISSTHSSPQNSNANFTQPESTVDDNANYAITPSVLDTPSKTLKRSTSIKYVNDVDDEPVYYNETPTTSYVEQPAAYFEPAPGNPQA